MLTVTSDTLLESDFSILRRSLEKGRRDAINLANDIFF